MRITRYLTGSPLKIVVGPDKRHYYVHPDVLSSCKLSALEPSVKEVWKSSGDGAIDWTDFDHQTVEQVLTFLYTGDYHIPLPDTDDTQGKGGSISTILAK